MVLIVSGPQQHNPAKDCCLVEEFGVPRIHLYGKQRFSFGYEVSVDSLICPRKKKRSFVRKEISVVHMFQLWQAPSLLCEKIADLHSANLATTSQPSTLQRAQGQNRRSEVSER